VNDVSGLGYAHHPRELDPLDVPDDGELHGGSFPHHLTTRRSGPFQRMMDTAVSAIPPFERFYEQHRDEILGYLIRLLGKQGAEDAFQETFLRALRGYPKLVHGRELRAWAFTIATRVALDVRRRREPTLDVPEIGTTDSLPAYAELAHLADELPEKERAAVVLRYGYDLAYEDIATALGSSEDAARQAASSGVRRLRRRMT
jgi:RNA polymerase sigma factor (sigma-70 family)